MKRFMKTIATMGLGVLVGISLHSGVAFGAGGERGKPISTLTDEQRIAVHEKIEEMRSDGASPEEIHDAVAEMFKEYGVEMPEHLGRQGLGMVYLSSLSEEQRASVRQRIREMRNSGASRDEIHTEVRGMLKDYGVEEPEHVGAFRRNRAAFSALTEDQRKAVKEKVEGLKDAGATREEIQEEVARMLEGYGVEMGERAAGFPGQRAVLSKLSPEQRSAVQEKMRAMRDAGATREEIHKEVGAMLKGYGIDIPDEPGVFRRHRPVFAQLTEDQRSAVREKVKSMHEAGATHEQIHAEVNAMLEGYGVEAPRALGRGPGRRGMFEALSVEQRRAVREKINAMRDQGASREEIREAVALMLKEYGVNISDQSNPMMGGVRGGTPTIETHSHPNPASDQANIAYTLNAASDVRVDIYNTAGQLVRSFDMGDQEPGSHTVQWDGKYEDGRQASSGMYLYRIQTGNEAVTNCIVLLK